jgi:hypothetical protein
MKSVVGDGHKTNSRSGQAMLIAVLALGGAILGATTVAGLLTLYQIRATTDTARAAYHRNPLLRDRERRSM